MDYLLISILEVLVSLVTHLSSEIMFSRLVFHEHFSRMYIKAYKYICVLTIAHHFGGTSDPPFLI